MPVVRVVSPNWFCTGELGSKRKAASIFLALSTSFKVGFVVAREFVRVRGTVLVFRFRRFMAALREVSELCVWCLGFGGWAEVEWKCYFEGVEYSAEGLCGLACPILWSMWSSLTWVVHLLLWKALRSLVNWEFKTSNLNWTWCNSCILILCLYSILSISSMQWVHCLLVCPISPHLLHNLCTLSYLHCTQNLNLPLFVA